jgi:hypothetical protein
MIKWRKVKKDFKKRGRLKGLGKKLIFKSEDGTTYRGKVVAVKVSKAKKWRIRYTPITEPVELPKELYNMNPLGCYIDNNFIPY